MKINSLKKRLDELLKINDSFLREVGYHTGYTYDVSSAKDLNTKSPSTVIICLKNLGYEFKQKEFDDFIKRACVCDYGDSYISNLGYFAMQQDYREQCIDIMFTAFNPTNEQIDMITNCYIGYGYHAKKHEWISVLTKKGFKFNTPQLMKLQSIGCNVNQLLADEPMNLDMFNQFLTQFRSFDNSPGEQDVLLIRSIVERNNIMPNTNSIISIIHACLETSIIVPTVRYFIELGAEFTKECANIILSDDQMFSCDTLIDLIAELGFVPTMDNIRTYINRIDAFKNDDEYHGIVLYIIGKYAKPNTDDLNFIISNLHQPYVDVNEIGLPLDELLPHCKQQIDDEYFDYGTPPKTKTEDCYVSVVSYLIEKGAVPNFGTLQIVCEQGDLSSYKKITREFKIVPDKECLDAIFRKGNINNEMIVDILNYKITPDLDNFKGVIKRNSDNDGHILELFIKAGLNITLEMIDYALYRRYKIDKLDRFGIPEDEKLYYLCYRNDFFCYDFKDIDPNIIKMRKMCKNGKIDVNKFFKFVTTNGLKLDNYCLEFAKRHNSKLSKVLFKHFKCEPTIGCILPMKAQHQTMKTFKKILDSHKVTMGTMTKKLSLDIAGYITANTTKN